jgi:hypothetical protein
MKNARSSSFPSHILYVDDVMIFCKGTASNIYVGALTILFQSYANNINLSNHHDVIDVCHRDWSPQFCFNLI